MSWGSHGIWTLHIAAFDSDTYLSRIYTFLDREYLSHNTRGGVYIIFSRAVFVAGGHIWRSYLNVRGPIVGEANQPNRNLNCA